MGGNESRHFPCFAMAKAPPLNANPTKWMQIRHKSDANPTQILRKSHATLTQIPPTGYYKELPRACFRFVTVAVYAQGPSPHVLFIFTVLLESMPPRGPNAKAIDAASIGGTKEAPGRHHGGTKEALLVSKKYYHQLVTA